MSKKKLGLIVLLALCRGLLRLRPRPLLSLDALTARQARFRRALCRAARSPSSARSSCVYVAVTALSLPGATILTLAAGALFGLVAGTLLVSFASSIGATLAFLAARYVLRDSVQRRFGARLAADRRRARAATAPSTCFTLRLVPLVPFFVINLADGADADEGRHLLLGQPARHARRHRRLRERRHRSSRSIDSLRGILSPALIGSLRAARRLPAGRAEDRRGACSARKVYARWRGAGRSASTATWSSSAPARPGWCRATSPRR